MRVPKPLSRRGQPRYRQSLLRQLSHLVRALDMLRSSPLQHTCCGQHQRSMAELSHGLLAIEEVSQDAYTVWMIANVLWRSSTWDHEGHVVGWIDIGEGDVGVPGVARLFRVGIEAGLKIMHDKMQLLFCGGRYVNLVSFFFQSLIRIHDLERLSGIAGQN